ncbi:BNR-4 repeat-containing protein [Algoriphagus sp. H41]|uniref:BNR-4 repeat-containing protein n=1 Tax=Algoriphagus oliviformis TaxID=2811231 RepID=A0ABS3C8P3_9BACT|nr:BNR-4 repeat-containing protein [Algoriphagus oliviformis]MBN7813485.1 BNR-4 repeat-containing protein [Algoriphagus oliviformis]
MKNILSTLVLGWGLSLCLFAQQPKILNQQDTGYRGIWYSNEPSNDEYVYKYSGGLATYPANHYPFSIYVPEVDKTFFCYGGADPSGATLWHMISYYDHKTGRVPRPTVVLDKETDNAHDNPVMNIDAEGYLWIFSTAHGTGSPSYVHKSKKPYDIAEFERVHVTKMRNGKRVEMDNFSYLQSWYQPGNGFINLFTHYETKVVPGQPSKPRRTIGYMTSADGVDYSEWKDLAAIEEGHYQTSGQSGNKLGTSFNFHPITEGANGLNFRTNLYYLQTEDFGKSWQTAQGETLDLPLNQVQNPALVKDYSSMGRLVYINDLAFDQAGRPVILYVTSKGYEAGPANGPRTWNTARFTGSDWEILPVTDSDNNYDMGSLYMAPNGEWRIVGPTSPGPQAYNTGGEMVLWISKNQGKTWKSKPMTSNSEFNHSYARRPVQVHDEFYAFWADGNGREKSFSRLYFSDKKGNVYLLPTQMDSDFAKPMRVKSAKRPRND